MLSIVAFKYHDFESIRIADRGYQLERIFTDGKSQSKISSAKIIVVDNADNSIKELAYGMFCVNTRKDIDNLVIMDKTNAIIAVDEILMIPLSIDVACVKRDDVESKLTIELTNNESYLISFGCNKDNMDIIKQFTVGTSYASELTIEDFKSINYDTLENRWSPEWALSKMDSILKIDSNDEDIRNEINRISLLFQMYNNLKSSNSRVSPEDVEDCRTSTSKSRNAVPDDSLGEHVGDPNCPICKGVGRLKSISFGLIMPCNCVRIIEQRKEIENKRLESIKKLRMNPTSGEAKSAVLSKLVPESRAGDSFMIDMLDKKVKILFEELNARLDKEKYLKYRDSLMEINKIISMGSYPTHSYMISAPNGFSKTTFANTCISRLSGMGKPMVPYKSLDEIATIQDYHILNRRFVQNRQYDKQISKESIGGFDWNDFLNANILFCFLTSPDLVDIEIPVLKTLLSIRGTKGLATVVFAERPINVYRTKEDVELFLMSDIVAYSRETTKYDRPLVIEVIKNKATRKYS